ncbi:U-scoloptoxin(19)-Sm1a [Drosophila grimshawi]|uniref:GH20050 n=1 Tax=Drosophila grimshawi TaxID=7222 RepID=B4J7L3_DROGR|nr:U-scoloptoxin(19)-Sm1a [Drosophila grimshawi]EDW02161.1 GH20050 [Drosophila grimshawi]
MSNTSIFLGLCLVSAIMLQFVCADIETNEVNDNDPKFFMHEGVRVYLPHEEECVKLGGLCIQTRDCDKRTSYEGLCPTNKKYGVECCFEYSVKPAPCSHFSGECMERCNKDLERPGNDCNNGEVCCVLV